VAIKVAESAPAATATEAGVLKRLELSESATVAAPAGAACESVTVQVVLPFAGKLPAAHCSDVTVTGAFSDRLAVFEEPFSEAVRVAVWLAVKEPAVAVKVALLAPEGMVTDVGTVTRDELDATVATAPPDPAAALRFMVQVAGAAGANAAGLQVSPVIVIEGPGWLTGALTVMLAPLAEVVLAPPAGEAPIGWFTPIGTAPLALAESVTETVARIPLGIVVAFEPETRHV
jgi:hypothetical protein